MEEPSVARAQIEVAHRVPSRAPVPESGTTEMLSDGAPRFIVPLCWSTNEPRYPASASPATCSGAGVGVAFMEASGQSGPAMDCAWAPAAAPVTRRHRDQSSPGRVRALAGGDGT